MIEFLKMSQPFYRRVYVHWRGPKQVTPEKITFLNTIHNNVQNTYTSQTKKKKAHDQPTQLKKKNLLCPESPIIILLQPASYPYSRFRRLVLST
jgi:hypothetical protein